MNLIELLILICGWVYLVMLLAEVKRKLRKVKMTIDELGAALDALAAQLNKALQEILAEIQALGTVPQPIVDKLTAAQAVAQQLDDLNPDQP